ncbi:MAG: NAD-dependent epimerase/dehydratase family protein [Dehalococcoidia bacterium]|tara:strand:+ start:346 stop:1215 length:870 start_codon:yes stop_codon:yes gene_type:complete
MKITISGSSGYLGKSLVSALSKENFEINCLLRNKNKKYFWDPQNNFLPQNLIDESQIIINLNGERIINPFKRKKISEIKSSRISSTKTLINSIKNSKTPPKLIISASACGIYGDRPNEIIDERSPKGRGIIADLVEEWESIQQLEKTRVVFLRFGTIIDKNADIYTYMKKYSSIIGINKIGSGKNYFPWISKIDAIRAILHIINNEKLKGPINLVSKNQITLGEVFREINMELKPVIKLRIPRISVPIIFGKLGEEILLSDQKIIPTKLNNSGFNWMNTTPSGSISLTP